MPQTLPPGTGSAKSATRDPGRPTHSDMAGGSPAEEQPMHDPIPAPQPPGPPDGSEPIHDPPPSPLQDRIPKQAGRRRAPRTPRPGGTDAPGNAGTAPPDPAADGVLFDENQSGR